MVTHSPQRPRQVVTGSSLLAVSVGAGLVHVLLNAAGAGHMDSVPEPRWSVFFGLVLFVEGATIWFAYCGRNWARIICALGAVLTLSSVGTAFRFLQAYDFHPLLLSSWLTALLGIVGAIALFLPAANSWYAAARSHRAAV